MKRLLALCIGVMILLTGCSKQPTKQESSKKIYVYGLWVTCFELEKLNNNGFETGFENLVKQAADLGINNLFVHIKAFDKCIFNSNFFEQEAWCEQKDYNVLEYIIDLCHKNKIKLHAWINPYRISYNKDYVLPTKFKDFKENIDFCRTENGVYFNPASAKARSYITGLVKEALLLKVDGIHFDDYFYPTVNEDFDKESYSLYVANTKTPLDLAEYRRNQVNSLIVSVKSSIEHISKDALFSVSPAADIKKNYNVFYADIVYWCSSSLIDAVIPQLYFGFNYPDEAFSFENLVIEWSNALKDCDVDIFIGLAPYKLGTNLGPDKQEWENGSGVVADQIKNIYQRPFIKGVVFFSYSSLFLEDELHISQKEKIKETIKKGE